MKISISALAPITEFRAQPEGAARLTHQIVFIDPEQVVQAMKTRQRRLAKSNGGVLRRFNHPNLAKICLKAPGQRCSGKPRRRAAAGNRNALDSIYRQETSRDRTVIRDFRADPVNAAAVQNPRLSPWFMVPLTAIILFIV